MSDETPRHTYRARALFPLPPGAEDFRDRHHEVRDEGEPTDDDYQSHLALMDIIRSGRTPSVLGGWGTSYRYHGANRTIVFCAAYPEDLQG